jgi:hypothetical protein
MLAGKVVASQAGAVKGQDDMIQRDLLCPGRSHAAWPFILDTGRIERVQGPSLIATLGRRGHNRTAWLRRLEARL